MGSTHPRYFVEDATAEREAKIKERGRSKERVRPAPEGEGAFGVGKADEGRHIGGR